jgi:trehalose-phosphatase
MVEALTSVDQIRHVLEQRPLLVLTDVDGTLSPIVDRAEDAFVPAEIKQALSALIGRGVSVAAITGRSLEVARRMVDVPGVDFAASHGVDVWVEGRSERPQEVAEWSRQAREALAELRAVEGRGVWIEDKEFGLAIHYRQAADGEAARERILAGIAASAPARGFEMQEGRMIVELRPRLAMNKGTAAAAMIERLGATGVLCLGDDVTDIDMFREVGGRRAGGPSAAIVAVRSEEASGEVAASADYWVDGVDGVGWLLGEVARATA